MNFCIQYGDVKDPAPVPAVLVAFLDGRVIGSAAKLPGADEERWCVVPADVPEQVVHRGEEDYRLVTGEPAARAALEVIAATLDGEA